MIKTTVASIIFYLLLSPTFLYGQSKKATDYIVFTLGDTIFGTLAYLHERGTTPKYYKKNAPYRQQRKTQKI
jgi:hypothetical protein